MGAASCEALDRRPIKPDTRCFKQAGSDAFCHRPAPAERRAWPMRRREVEHAPRLAAARWPASLQRQQTQTGVISQQMLTRTLRGLERDRMVTRMIFPTSPPQVEYRLTELGRSMSEPVLAFGKWVQEHRREVDAARDQFDQRAKSERGPVDSTPMQVSSGQTLTTSAA
jgi:DNA-binding HxlR family transcriptional regulator